ncbi:methyl-accepting chemotaxis protein [Methylobacterium sp.]|uniref:methyl-accepting chemotaxis protein n=1 Tax=Methylobacterium sp. TaxID=409 RepID=UPI0025EE9F00|nr:methyl-accepting chemotaxis protein [Methylobacterium sp.]
MSCGDVDEVHSQSLAADQSTLELKTAAKSMSSVVQLIHGVGVQNNLLALDATIEAARAGDDAPRGFAVSWQERSRTCPIR